MTGLALIARRPRLVVMTALLVTGLAMLPARQVRVRTDLVNLLPSGAPAADGYRAFLELFGGAEKVFLLIVSESPGALDDAALAEAASWLEERLLGNSELVAVQAGLEEHDEEFFLRYVVPRTPLLLGDDWRAVVVDRLEPAAIRRRVASLKANLRTPAGSAAATLARGDPLGFSEALAAATARDGLPMDPLTSTFASRRGGAALLVLTPARAELDPAGGRRLLAALEAACADARQHLGDALRCRAVGGPLYAAQDEKLLRQDLRWTLAGSLTGTALILVAAFEGLLLPLVTLAPLLLALVWACGILGVVHPEVSTVSIGFGAVLVGLGVDYGIHGGARFRQQVLTSPHAGAALGATARHAGPGILTSALTTAAAFATLALASLEPLRELGWLVALGCLTILAAMVTVGSAGLTMAAPHLRRPGRAWHWLRQAVEVTSGMAARRPRLVLTAAALVSAVALAGLGRLSIDADPGRLRPEDHPVFETERLLGEHFGIGLDTAHVLVPGHDTAEALEQASRAAAVLRRELGAGVEVTSPSDYLESVEAATVRLSRLAALPFAAAADTLEQELRAANLDPRAFTRGIEALRALGRGEDPGAPAMADWPGFLTGSLRRGPDAVWAAISLRLPANTWPEGPPAELSAQVAAVAPGSLFASAVALGGELRELATGDLRKLALLALMTVTLVVALSLAWRGPVGHGPIWRDTVLTVLPVVLGSLWTLGLWSAGGKSLDLFSLAVLPIMLGIGLDDGLHVVHGSRQLAGPSRLRGAVRGAGRALALTTLTTSVGFASLGLSAIPGLRAGGGLIAAGVLACWLCTVMVLPAVEAIIEGKSMERAAGAANA